MFMDNAWYAAAWGREVRSSPLGRQICDRPIVMYRLEDGTPVALEDICCHRMLPLSHGRVEGDLLVCGYHGLTYDKTGQCVRIPSQEKTIANARVRSYPIVERHHFVWVWIGDPALADFAAVPDLHWNNDPGWRGDGDVVRIECDYRLLVDNLLDLSHETYVHSTSIGDPRLPSAPIKTSFDHDTVTVSRWIPDHEPAPFWRNLVHRARNYTGHCDRWQIAWFVPPCSVVIDVGVAEAGTGALQGDRSKGISAMILNSLTPATVTSCWYFWANARNFCLDDDGLTADMKASITRIFGEDKVIVEAQQRAMLENPGFKMISINLDAGPIRVRRLIEARIRKAAAAA